MKNQLTKDIRRLIEGWKKYAPALEFAGMTVQEFEAKFNDLAQLLRVMEVLRNEYSGKIAVREGLVGDLNLLFLQIVDAIKGDKRFGRWSEFYRFLGYKTPDEKHSPSPEPSESEGTDEATGAGETPPEGGDLPKAA